MERGKPRKNVCHNYVYVLALMQTRHMCTYLTLVHIERLPIFFFYSRVNHGYTGGVMDNASL